MGIKGASISGGEPFITPKRSLAYLRACRKRMGDSLYFWLYTNGSLAKPEILEQLRDEGLNEIRFNLAAWDYNLKMIRRAVGIIDTVTVETPAIPEDVEKMRETILELSDMGVKHINLHQLRATTYNCRNLVQRNYCLVEGPHPAVVESELTALDLMLFAAENDLPIGINYCSFIYRNRYQRAAVQSQAARHTIEPWEDLTETGMIRRLSVKTDNMEQLARKCGDMAGEGRNWHYDETSKKLYMNMELYRSLDEKPALEAEYMKASLLEEAPLSENYKPDAVVKLDAGKNIHVVRTPVFSVSLEGSDLDKYLGLLSSGTVEEKPAETKPKVIKLKVPDPFTQSVPEVPEEIPAEKLPWDEIEFSEYIQHGLQKYQESV